MNWTKKQLSILAIVAATSFMGTFLISSVNIALPAIGKSFDLTAVTLSWVITAFLLATAMFLLPIGRWADLSGVSRLFKVGVILFTSSSVLCAVSPTETVLIVFRFLQGIGAAFTITTGPAILVSAFNPQYRGRVLGYSVSSVYLGLAFGPFVGGMLTQYFGWRSIFYVASAIGIVIALIAFAYLDKDAAAPQKGKKVDWKGTLLYMVGLVFMVYGSSHIPTLSGWMMLVGGTLLLVVFWFFENRTEAPVLETRLFTHNRLFAYSNMAALINYSATYAIVFLLSLYLQKVKGLSPRDAGLILIAQPTVMAVFSPLAGRLSDKVQPRYLTTLGMTMCTLGLAGFAFITANTPIAMIVALLIWVGLGFASFSSPNMSTIMGSVNKNQLGLASGTSATMRVVGQITSMTIATIFFAALFNGKTIDLVPVPTFLKAVQQGFLVFTLISAVGIYFSYYRGKVERH